MTTAPLPGPKRPKLARKARLRFDERAQRWLLLYPERGIALSASASEVLRRCDGSRTVADIVRELASEYGGADAAQIERDVRAFLASLSERGLLEDPP